MSLQQQFSKPYFCFNPTDDKSVGFVQVLKSELGDFTVEESDIIVDVGGDGTILYAFQNLPNKPNFGLKPPTSSSKLYHGHHNILDGTMLHEAYNNAALIDTNALKADIHMSDDSVVTIYAYADIIVSSFTSQAVLSDIESDIQIDGGSKHRVMSGGSIVATPMGSTARSRSCGGTLLNLSDRKIVITSDGNPVEDGSHFFGGESANSVTYSDDVSVGMQLVSAGNKRPVRILYDSSMILPDGEKFTGFPLNISGDRYITGLSIHTDYERTRQILRNEEYATHSL